MPTTKITVISSNVTKSGDGWQLSELTAVDQHGLPITKTLKTFEQNLPFNQLIDVEVERNQDPRYDEYMVRLPGSKRGGGGGGGGGKGLGQSVDLIRQQVESLQTRVTALEARVAAVTQQPTPGQVTPPPQPATAIGGPLTDDDIPF